MDPSKIVGMWGPGALGAIDSTGPDVVWAVGAVGQGTSSRPLAVHGTDHGAMQMVALPDLGDLGGSALSGVKVVDAASVWMGGTGYGVQRRDSRPHILHWDGTRVTVVSIPTSLLQGDSQAVASLTASSDHDVWVELYERSYTERWTHWTSLHWDGTAWLRAELPSKVSSWSLAATTTSGAWAAGRDKFAHWDGTAWRRATPPPGYQSYSWGALGTNGHDLAVSYTTSGLGVGPVTIARWTGRRWATLPATPSGYAGGPVFAPDGTLFTSGGFNDEHYPLHRIVSAVQRWDGVRWTVSGIPSSAARETQQGFTDVLTGGFTATSATAVTATGRAGLDPYLDGTPWVGRWCTGVVRADGITRPATLTLWGSPVAVRADGSLTGTHTLVDDASLFTPRPLAAGAMTDFSYPGAGTYTARVTGVPGTLVTSVPMQLAVDPDHGLHTLWWASSAPPYGWHSEVQMAPASDPTHFADVTVAYNQTHLTLRPHAHLRSEIYRARLVRQDGVAGGWSPTITATY